jgi:pyridinium-3,5-biscarboxylic acid mononucleotide sulfurtransferase
MASSATLVDGVRSDTLMPPAELEAKWEALLTLLQSSGGTVIAFSGGVDSTFLLAAAGEALGGRALGVTALSETYPKREAEGAAELARRLGARHRFIVSEELELPEFKENPRNRCYYCKRELFAKLREVADAEGLGWVCDGSNLDDENDHRPGKQAAAELDVRSPLRDVGLSKDDIRALSHWLGLPTWDKPSFACLSSRFPYGTAITRERVRRLDQAENALRDLGFSQIRLRYHHEVGRLEVRPEEFALLLEPEVREAIVAAIKTAGFVYAAFDLQGYRTGAMNEVPQ